MKRHYKRFFATLLLGVALFGLSGCVGRPRPVLHDVGGCFFIVGDPDCVQFKRTKNPRYVLCMDAQGHVKGKRRAMTNQELLMYTHYQQMRQLRSIEAELMFQRMTYWDPWYW
ncbi:hypothetical protein [Nitratifractor salsuginis]|uniref:Lipoprotein n=1 Tax=Nitratifractor salsuginis (strain DSM 16511 / JCM 12458 / E9I37-1) TaxID=749222 RepID=E6WZQ6_NITSE|nr:hypothetical protein [Nitratifractor salsuginis]ADV46697.1 hypothetical protein Nitsa_1448 [Nitratifractor salsuginis DSM 16511]